MNIEMGKKYQTRDGRAVRILCVDNVGDLSVVGVFVDGEVNRWHADGTFCAEYPLTGHRDLIPVPTKHEGWCLVDIQAPSYATRAEAERAFHEGVYAVRSPASYRYQIKRTTWEDE